MCARFVLKKQKQDLEAFFDLRLSMDLVPRFNIAPTQQVLALRETEAGRRGALLTWGLVPRWAKDPKVGAMMVNARAETVGEKPAFRDAYRYRRCLIPADGFYEWEKIGKAKQPWFIYRADGDTAAFAGLWEHWQDPNGTEIETCTIITTVANEMMQRLHDRMPVVLEREQWARWLSPRTEAGEVDAMLVPGAAGILACHTVAREVGDSRRDEARFVEKVDAAPEKARDEGGQMGLFG
ncbi:MAG TPA: SOS response-associated peptidase [Phycisphaerae bacterium]|nr:SOS response-associated peptidase [Phycisphaerae bacterium]